MTTESPWCVIVNLKTCKTGWKKWQLRLDKGGIHYLLHFTESVSELSLLLQRLVISGHNYFLFMGGDGTIHHGGNLLLQHAGARSAELVIGLLPCGTGNDWVRSFGIPKNQIIECLHKKTSAPFNILKISWPDGSVRFAFNMIGGALDAAVVDLLNGSSVYKNSFLKYPLALLKTLLKPHSWNGIITVDDRQFEHDWLSIEAGFGQYCGGGMYVLPHAEEGVPVLLLMKQKSLFKIFLSLPKLYNGNITQQKEAIAIHFTSLNIQHTDVPIPLQADGEWLGYSPVKVNPVFGAIQRLIAY